jgi:hypothetical protein
VGVYSKFKIAQVSPLDIDFDTLSEGKFFKRYVN